MHFWTTKSGYKIYRVLGFRCNAFVLTNSFRHILIDCGSTRYRRQLIWSLAKLGIYHIDALVLTHSHFDHASNSRYIQNRFGAVVMIHKAEAQYLENGSSPLPKGTTWLTRLIVKNFGRIATTFIRYIPCNAEIILNGNYALNNFGFNALIFPTPGHSKGSVSISIDDELVLVGDALYGLFPWQIKPPFADDTGSMIESWKRILETRANIFIPSHGKPISRELLKKIVQSHLAK